MLEDHPLSAVRNCLLNILAVTLRIGPWSTLQLVTLYFIFYCESLLGISTREGYFEMTVFLETCML